MTAAIAIRPDLDTTIASLRESRNDLRTGFASEDVSIDRIRIDVEANSPTIHLGDRALPVSETGLNSMADYFSVPSPFFKRLGNEVGMDAQAYILTRLMERSSGSSVRAEYTSGGLVGLTDPGNERLDPSRLLTVAERTLGTDQAPVQRLVDSSAEFAFDVHVPFDYERGVGGDRNSEIVLPEELLRHSWTSKAGITADSKVGDITAAGLRFGFDRKRNLSPWVMPWSMRLACTNGMEFTDNGLKLDARGLGVDEVLAELEALAEIAFSAAESNIVHFYDLRNTPVDNPERALRAIARERGIPDRSLVRMLDLAPSEILPPNPTQFDVVNLVTNLANHAAIRNDGGRLLLERAGGGIIAEHAARCGHCQHVLA